MHNPFRKAAAVPSPSVVRDIEKDNLDLLATIFGAEEAKKYLLNEVAVKDVSPEQVLRDASAVELMMRTFPWKTYTQAVWRTLLTKLRLSIGGKTLEERESNRSQVLGILAVLHLPYELSSEKKRIEQMKQMEREALGQI